MANLKLAIKTQKSAPKAFKTATPKTSGAHHPKSATIQTRSAVQLAESEPEILSAIERAFRDCERAAEALMHVSKRLETKLEPVLFSEGTGSNNGDMPEYAVPMVERLAELAARLYASDNLLTSIETRLAL